MIFDYVSLDRAVSELVDLRPGGTFDLVVAGSSKPMRVILDAVLEDSLIVHLPDCEPIRIFKTRLISVSLPGGD